MNRRYQLIDGVLVPVISGGIDDGGDPLVDDPEHAGVTDDELEAAAARQFETPAATTAEEDEPTGGDGPSADGEEGAGGEDVEGASPPATEPVMIDLGDGVEVALDEVRTLHGFGQFLRENPSIAARVEAALRAEEEAGGEGAPAKPPAEFIAPEPPEGIDLDDPAIAALWQQHVDSLAWQSRMEATLRAHDDYITNSTRTTMESLAKQARTTFQTEHNLSEAEMDKVYELAGRLQVLPALMDPVDPVTGVPRAVDPLAAMKQSFEIARWQIPELREREVQLLADERKVEGKRKKKLSSLGGSGGTAPKTKPEPTTEAGRRAAMIEQVAAYQRGEGELA